jgi:hypothetical protein
MKVLRFFHHRHFCKLRTMPEIGIMQYIRKIPWPSWLQCLVAAGNKPWKTTPRFTAIQRRLRAGFLLDGPGKSRRTEPPQPHQDRGPPPTKSPPAALPWPAVGASRSTRGRHAKQRKRRKRGWRGSNGRPRVCVSSTSAGRPVNAGGAVTFRRRLRLQEGEANG